MAGGRLRDGIGMREELIMKACSLAMKAHRSPAKPYIVEKSRSSPEVVLSFPGVWSVNDWFAQGPFGKSEVDLQRFPSLRSIGNDDVAAVNEAFMRRFEGILANSSLQNEVQKATKEEKQVVFTGHSSGAAIAILATLWFLEIFPRSNTTLCVTFGSPLIGDRIFAHALRRENWAHYFIHFVIRYDIVPRIFLAPLPSIEWALQPVLHFFKSNSTVSSHEVHDASTFYVSVMRNVSSVTSHAACNLMGCSNMLLETVSSFIELSPYRPFGTYVFCTGNGKLVTVKNPDAILQLLFYSTQLTNQAEGPEIASRSLQEHLVYERELQESLQMQNVVHLDNLEELPLSMDAGAEGGIATIIVALNDLGLTTRARLCLRAAGELEKQKERNVTKINNNKSKIKDGLNMIEGYQAKCEVRHVGYYDAFKLQKDTEDFNINVKRLELAGMWDEIIEMLKRYELPEEFEGQKEWIELGTRYRRIVESLDIANYYRHGKNEDTGPYMKKGRPKRYRYTQRWHEHAQKLPAGSSWESCFWAEVEELCINSNTGSAEDVERVTRLEREVLRWYEARELGKDVFLAESTFAKWWKSRSPLYRSGSCISKLVNE